MALWPTETSKDPAAYPPSPRQPPQRAWNTRGTRTFGVLVRLIISSRAVWLSANRQTPSGPRLPPLPGSPCGPRSVAPRGNGRGGGKIMPPLQISRKLFGWLLVVQKVWWRRAHQGFAHHTRRIAHKHLDSVRSWCSPSVWGHICCFSQSSDPHPATTSCSTPRTVLPRNRPLSSHSGRKARRRVVPLHRGRPRPGDCTGAAEQLQL
jgi:hypothetical protein